MALTLAAVAVAGLLAAAAIVAGGFYDVSATRPHTQPVFSLLETTLRQSVRRAARSIEEPPLDAPALARRGAVCFRDHCTACHGAPGIAPEVIGIAVQPLPGPLVDAAATWRARELAWIVRNGIRMSGMPAWGRRLADDDLWALVAFIRAMPSLSPAAHAQLLAGLRDQDCPLAGDPDGTTVPPDAERGRLALHAHGCQGCHVIPGVVGSRRDVGPPLAHFGRRTRIAGRLPNTQAALAAWIVDPQQHDPGSAMPPLGVGPADARDMAAYLLSLR